MLRALRVLRVLRLITALPALKRVVAGLLAALPGMGSIVLLIGLIYYVFAVMATKLFGDDKPEHFGTLGESLFTLFTVMTLEGWVEVAKGADGKAPMGLAVLRHLHRGDHLHGAQPVHRRRGQRHAGGSGEDGRAEREAERDDHPGGGGADPRPR